MSKKYIKLHEIVEDKTKIYVQEVYLNANLIKKFRSTKDPENAAASIIELVGPNEPIYVTDTVQQILNQDPHEDSVRITNWEEA
jgi:hypothetical protein